MTRCLGVFAWFWREYNPKEVAEANITPYRRNNLKAAYNTFALILQLPFFLTTKEEFLEIAPELAKINETNSIIGLSLIHI